MKIIFFDAECEVDINFLKKFSSNIRVGLVSTIQFSKYLDKAKKIIKNSIIGGEIIGCNLENAIKIKDDVDAFLYIGTGKFHPIQISLATEKDVYIANPVTKVIEKLNKRIVEKRKRAIKGAYLKFLSSKKIGMLVSTKIGQKDLKGALDFKKSLKDKETFIFLFDTLRFEELENFREIEVWVNTACPTIAYEDFEKFGKPIINLKDLKKFINNL